MLAGRHTHTHKQGGAINKNLFILFFKIRNIGPGGLTGRRFIGFYTLRHITVHIPDHKG
jgi:hypothetical protein